MRSKRSARSSRSTTSASQATFAGAICLGVALMWSACGATAPIDASPTEVRSSPVRSDVVQLYLRAELHLRDDDPAQAARAFRDAVAIVPDDPYLRLRLASAEGLAGDIEAAEHQARVAQTIGAPPWEAALTYARALDAQESYDDAVDVLQDVDPSGAPERFYVSYFGITGRAERHDARLRGAEAYVIAYPEIPRAWRFLGVSARTVGDIDRSVEAFQRAALLPGGDPWDAEQWASTLLDNGRASEAHGAVDACLQRYRTHVACHILRIRLFADEHRAGEQSEVDVETTPEALSRAIDHLAQLTGNNRQTIATTGHGLVEATDARIATDYARAVARLRPHNVTSTISAAWVAYRARDEDLAIDLMLRALDLDEANFEALNFVGYTWADRGVELERALAFIERAVELRPHDGNILDSLAWVYFRLGRFDEALVVQERAIELVPENAVVLDHYGDMLYAVGRRAEAIQAWTRAVEIATEWDEDVLTRTPPKIEAALRDEEVPVSR